MRKLKPSPTKHTPREKEGAYARLEKANLKELELVSTHILGYNMFEQGRKELRLPSEVRAQCLKILKSKIILNHVTFEKTD